MADSREAPLKQLFLCVLSSFVSLISGLARSGQRFVRRQDTMDHLLLIVIISTTIVVIILPKYVYLSYNVHGFVGSIDD
jgi:hypothetical protein